jgi:hypothetical protein
MTGGSSACPRQNGIDGWATGRFSFNPETLAATWRGKHIGDVLKTEVDEAVEFFAAMPSISHPLKLLQDVDLQMNDVEKLTACCTAWSTVAKGTHTGVALGPVLGRQH